MQRTLRQKELEEREKAKAHLRLLAEKEEAKKKAKKKILLDGQHQYLADKRQQALKRRIELKRERDQLEHLLMAQKMLTDIDERKGRFESSRKARIDKMRKQHREAAEKHRLKNLAAIENRKRETEYLRRQFFKRTWLH